jgi:signal transduction histidine kinase
MAIYSADGGDGWAASPAVLRLISKERHHAAAGGQFLALEALAAASAGILALELVHPVAYYAPTLRATADMMMTSFALIGAWMLQAQFRHAPRLRKLLVFGALLTLGLVDLFSHALPAVLEVRSGQHFAATLLWGKLFAGVAFAAAAAVLTHKFVAGGRRPIVVTAAVSVVALAVSELLGLLLRSQMVPGGIDPVYGIDRALGHPLGSVLTLAATGLFAYAAIAFARKSRSERSNVLALLSGASILLAFTRLYYFALPSFGPDTIASREGLRVLAYGLLFAAVMRQELQLRKVAVQAAAIGERRRVARDLHDGLAQDLAFIAAHGARIANELGEEHPVAVAARRALAISRGAIAELSDPAGATAHEALEAVAHELSDRFEISIAVDAQLDGEPSPYAREHLTRIAREAIANAARHGGAKHVIVSLKRTDGGVALRVRDDGSGIAGTASAPALEGFGLRSMSERAASLGGYMTVRRPGKRGTELEVMLP